MNTYNSSTYNQQASQALSDSFSLKLKIQQLNNEYRLLDIRELNAKNMIELYSQRIREAINDYIYINEVERYKFEIKNITYERNRLSFEIEQASINISQCLSNALSNSLQAFQIAIQNEDDFSLILIRNTINSIIQFINQTESDKELYKRIIRKCQICISPFTLSQINPNLSMIDRHLIQQVSDLLNKSVF